MNIISPLIKYSILSILLAKSASASIIESFDEAGSGLSNTIFSTTIIQGDGILERKALGVADGAPNTSPNLPINIGGDKELVYYEQTFSPYGSYAVTTQQAGSLFSNISMDAYIGFGAATFGSHTAGLLSRFSGSTIWDANSYIAYMGIDKGFTEGYLKIARIRNGVITSSDFLSQSLNFSIDPFNENYRLQFETNNDQLRASLWRVRNAGGGIIETPIETLFATDSALSSGDVGFRFFARNGNTVMVDDVSISTVPLPGSLGLIAIGLTSLLGLTRRRREKCLGSE